MYAWTVIILYVLFYVFDFLDYIKINNLDLFHNTFILLSMWAIPIALTISFTGMFIDYFPKLLDKLVVYSLLGSSLSLFIILISLEIKNSIIMVLFTILFGFFTGITIISGQTVYSISVPLENRNKIYAWVIIGATFISILTVSFFDSFTKEHFLIPLLIVSLLGILFSVAFYYMSRLYDFTWKNDVWPTKLKKILTRPSVIVYFWSHTLFWIMLGLMIGSLAQIRTQNASTLQFLQNLFSIDSYKGFWIVVLIGSMLLVYPAGWLSDKVGRKTLIIFGTTGMVLASLVIAIFNQFLISTLLIGISFGCVHAFSSLWVDLSSRDAIGRYNSLNFQSLGLGFLIGFLVSYFIYLDPALNVLNINIFIMLGIAVFASLPLFWISDSYPPLEFFLLLVTNKSGIPMFHYNFRSDETLKVDLSLISGAFTALNSFMTEAIGDYKGNLSLVRHGSHFIISDQTESGLSCAIFSNKNDPELQRLLKKFLRGFQDKYRNEIPIWTGDVNAFKDAINDAEAIFGHLISIKT